MELLQSAVKVCLPAALIFCFFPLTVAAASLPTPTNQLRPEPSRLVELVDGLAPDAYAARWELANISLDVLLSSYETALRNSTSETPSSPARKAKLYRWQRATQTLMASIEEARDRLLVDADFTIYADPQGQLILTVRGQPLSVTGLGRDDDRQLHDTIVHRYCTFNDCGDLLTRGSNAPVEQRLPTGHWQMTQAHRPRFKIDGLLECDFDGLTAREKKATACGELAKQINEVVDAIRAAGGRGVPVDWSLIAASRRPTDSATLLILNAAGDYLVLETPLIAQLPQAVWRTLLAHFAKRADDGLDTPYVIDGNLLLTSEPAR